MHIYATEPWLLVLLLAHYHYDYYGFIVKVKMNFRLTCVIYSTVQHIGRHARPQTFEYIVLCTFTEVGADILAFLGEITRQTLLTPVVT